MNPWRRAVRHRRREPPTTPLLVDRGGVEWERSGVMESAEDPPAPEQSVLGLSVSRLSRVWQTLAVVRPHHTPHSYR